MHMRVIWVIYCGLALLTAFGPIRRLPLPTWLRVVLGFCAFATAQGYLLQKLLDLPVMCPDGLPTVLLILAKWGDIATLLMGLFSIAWVVLRLCRVHVSPWLPPLSGMALGAVMLWLGVRQPPIVERTLTVRDLPASAQGMRVAVVADLHIDCLRGKNWCERFVARLNEARPDVVLFTGDQADGQPILRMADLAPLAKIVAPYGKFLVSGNHEFMFGVKEYLAIYQSLGLEVLDGKSADCNGITLLGVPDSRSLTNSETLPRLQGLMQHSPAAACTFLLAHKPAIAQDADALGVDVQFSGHTHGGQFPGLAMLMERFNDGYVRGNYTLPNGMTLFVAPGSATWIGFPFRLFYTTEVTLFTLNR